jgi:phenylalanyl-tRNA synthetase beta chain
MLFPESWLREFCNPPLNTQELADTLTMAGLEVESLRPVAPAFTGVVIGEIVTAEQHPNADRLRVCQVNVGGDALLSIVCGAPNARVGIRVPCATVGAKLPPAEPGGQPFAIKVGKLRGVESFGMLCSGKELGIDADHSGLLELPEDAPIGQNIREFLSLDDTVFELKLTPNLAHCLSVYGVARELSALTGAPLTEPVIQPVEPAVQDRLEVTVDAPDLCGRFSGRVVRGVNPNVNTPAWMVAKLARCGQRSVSPLVDISNYVMFELGRPSHIFDLDKIHGGLQVRWGRAGEKLELLNGSTIEVDDQVGVIADEQCVESLAGIMGGQSTAVSDETQNVFIEAAFWWPNAIAGRSRRYNFSTDAGHRFERGVDPSLTVEHVERITELVLQICGGQAGPIMDQTTRLPEIKPVALRLSRAAKVIGMSINPSQCIDAFTRLGMSVRAEGDVLHVTPGPHRFDINIEEDLIEEVARMIGYDTLPNTPPTAPITPKLRAENQRGPFDVRRSLAALGYQETINFSFVQSKWEHDLAGNPAPIKLLNPIASHLSVMRSSLLGSLMEVLGFNLDRKATRVRVFELGRVFRKNPAVLDSDTTVAGFDQPMHVAGLAYGSVSPTQWGDKERWVDFYDVKADVEALMHPTALRFQAAEHPAMHPGRCAEVFVGDRSIGFMGELHPKWMQEQGLTKPAVLFELALDAVLSRPVPSFKSVPKHQRVERDVAIWVADEVRYDEVIDVVHTAETQGLLKSAFVFDVYRPQGGETTEKSMALRLSLGEDQSSLTDEQIDSAVEAIVVALETKLGARLRA